MLRGSVLDAVESRRIEQGNDLAEKLRRERVKRQKREALKCYDDELMRQESVRAGRMKRGCVVELDISSPPLAVVDLPKTSWRRNSIYHYIWCMSRERVEELDSVRDNPITLTIYDDVIKNVDDIETFVRGKGGGRMELDLLWSGGHISHHQRNAVLDRLGVKAENARKVMFELNHPPMVRKKVRKERHRTTESSRFEEGPEPTMMGLCLSIIFAIVLAHFQVSVILLCLWLCRFVASNLKSLLSTVLGQQVGVVQQVGKRQNITRKKGMEKGRSLNHNYRRKRLIAREKLQKSSWTEARKKARLALKRDSDVEECDNKVGVSGASVAGIVISIALPIVVNRLCVVPMMNVLVMLGGPENVSRIFGLCSVFLQVINVSADVSTLESRYRRRKKKRKKRRRYQLGPGVRCVWLCGRRVRSRCLSRPGKTFNQIARGAALQARREYLEERACDVALSRLLKRLQCVTDIGQGEFC